MLMSGFGTETAFIRLRIKSIRKGESPIRTALFAVVLGVVMHGVHGFSIGAATSLSVGLNYSAFVFPDPSPRRSASLGKFFWVLEGVCITMVLLVGESERTTTGHRG